jgi:hypothetical protein
MPTASCAAKSLRICQFGMNVPQSLLVADDDVIQ